jgi:hypothetical protein
MLITNILFKTTFFQKKFSEMVGKGRNSRNEIAAFHGGDYPHLNKITRFDYFL